MSNKENELIHGEDYAMIPRKLLQGVNDGRLSHFELLVLLWLHIKAEFVTGTVDTSSNAIASALALVGKNQKNRVNKALLSLKENGYIYFPNHQGRRSNMTVELQHYRLTATTEKDISHRFQTDESRSETKVVKYLDIGAEKVSHKNGGIGAKNEGVEQKSKPRNEHSVPGKSEDEDFIDRVITEGEVIRGSEFYCRKEQREYINKLLANNVTPKRMLNTLKERMGDEYWIDREDKPTFKTVFEHLKNERV